MNESKSTEDLVAARHDRLSNVSGCSAHSSADPAFSPKHSEPPDVSRGRGDPERLEVLIVDDDASVLPVVKEVFEYFGYGTTTAGGSPEAMADLCVKQFDLVLTDFEMPGINGFRLATWIKAVSPATKVVIMTGSCRAEIPSFMMRGPVDDWMFKPFRLVDLCRILDQLGFPHLSSNCGS